jgi:hypothetical protein
MAASCRREYVNTSLFFFWRIVLILTAFCIHWHYRCDCLQLSGVNLVGVL